MYKKEYVQTFLEKPDFQNAAHSRNRKQMPILPTFGKSGLKRRFFHVKDSL